MYFLCRPGWTHRVNVPRSRLPDVPRAMFSPDTNSHGTTGGLPIGREIGHEKISVLP
ncbi:MAG: hypothetical protein LBC02_12495 [Planctomycetaceae bacterium]|nr:hypothetical protein [Planctomycetaceae bacterium]